MNLKDQKAAHTRQRFIDAAYELFQEQGYGATSMNQIARRANGSRANLYLHFRNKPDIMLAKMREIEPEIRTPISGVFALPEHTLEAIIEWLGVMREMWLAHAVDFSSMEQAMAEDQAVADEWLNMMRRLSSTIPELAGNEERRVQFLTALMSMDRNFYFLYVRNQTINEELVHRAIARQWLALFD
ncbi:TetR/AcrR family transcriptional regulator [Corynebacterium sp. A21]|uniref:TetR/AcrR family transcriptional regulator n=1 Tax=Corynebacterium sp. A21 TaxID=3457318 RepID=UPI003FD2E5D1